MAIFATIIFLINLRFIFVKKIRTLFWFNYFTISLFFFLLFICLSYFFYDFQGYVPKDFQKRVYLYRFKIDTTIDTFIILWTLLDKFDFTVDVCNEIS